MIKKKEDPQVPQAPAWTQATGVSLLATMIAVVVASISVAGVIAAWDRNLFASKSIRASQFKADVADILKLALLTPVQTVAKTGCANASALNQAITNGIQLSSHMKLVQATPLTASLMNNSLADRPHLSFRSVHCPPMVLADPCIA